MNNKMPFGGNMPRMNPMQMLQQLRQNPVQMLRQAGLNVPDNLTSPNDIIQHLMNSGQVSQDSYNRARQMAAQFKR
jgi:hypothetical protein